MTPEQKRLVQDSWSDLLPDQERVAQLFYERLFDMHPEVRTYFRGDIREQGSKLMVMMNTAVRGLDNLQALTEPLKHSGKMHRGYGVNTDDYAKVGDALLWTLEQVLGDAFDNDLRQAWQTTYTAIAGVMIEGAGGTTPQSA